MVKLLIPQGIPLSGTDSPSPAQAPAAGTRGHFPGVWPGLCRSLKKRIGVSCRAATCLAITPCSQVGQHRIDSVGPKRIEAQPKPLSRCIHWRTPECAAMAAGAAAAGSAAGCNAGCCGQGNQNERQDPAQAPSVEEASGQIGSLVPCFATSPLPHPARRPRSP